MKSQPGYGDEKDVVFRCEFITVTRRIKCSYGNVLCVNFQGSWIESKETVNHHTPPEVIMEICEYRNVSFDMSFCHH